MGKMIRFPVERTRKPDPCDVACAAPRPREAMRWTLVPSHSHPQEAESIWKGLGRFVEEDWAGDDWSEDKPD